MPSTKPRPAAKRRRYPKPKSAAVTRVMRANPRSGTKPEVAIRSLLHRAGKRFRKDYPIRVGGQLTRPDIVFPRQKIAIYIDGCFWHACPKHRTTPKHNAWYWLPKLRRNAERDRYATARLRRQGWQVVRAWEHEDASAVLSRTLKVLGADPCPV